MGHLPTSKGIRPDPMKVQAIQALPQPNDKKSVERLLGCIKYLSRFLPNLAEVVAPDRKIGALHSSKQHLIVSNNLSSQHQF